MKDHRRAAHIKYFLGVDPAPSESQESDDGGIIVLQAVSKSAEEISKAATDWMVNVVYGERVRKSVRGREKGYSANEWAGKIHKLHMAFTFAGIGMDPNGGGTFIKRALQSSKTVIDGGERVVTPIVTPDDIDIVGVSYPILSEFKRGDWAIKSVWEGMGGDEVLNHVGYQELKTAMELGQIGFIPPAQDGGKHYEEGSPLWWVQKIVTELLPEQLMHFHVQTNSDGTPVVSKRSALLFGSSKKKDLVSALMIAYVRFLTWLQAVDVDDLDGEGGEQVFVM